MNKDHLLYLLVGVSLILGGLLWASLTRAGRRARGRARRARVGEEEAEKLLTRHGYAIEDHQSRGEVLVEVDGVAQTFEVRADFLVWRRGRRFVAEVKTGEKVVELSHGSTRRQLLEYRRAFDVDGVLLVLPELSIIREVHFPDPAGPSPWRLVIGAFLLGMWVMMMVFLMTK